MYIEFGVGMEGKKTFLNRKWEGTIQFDLGIGKTNEVSHAMA